MLKALELPKLLKKSSLKETGASKNQNTVSRDNPGQNMRQALVLV